MTYDDAVDAAVGSTEEAEVMASSTGSGFDRAGCAGARSVVDRASTGGVGGDTGRTKAVPGGEGAAIGEGEIMATSHVNGSACGANRKFCKNKTAPMANPPCNRHDTIQPAASGFVPSIGCRPLPIMADE